MSTFLSFRNNRYHFVWFTIESDSNLEFQIPTIFLSVKLPGKLHCALVLCLSLRSVRLFLSVSSVSFYCRFVANILPAAPQALLCRSRRRRQLQLRIENATVILWSVAFVVAAFIIATTAVSHFLFYRIYCCCCDGNQESLYKKKGYIPRRAYTVLRSKKINQIWVNFVGFMLKQF